MLQERLKKYIEHSEGCITAFLRGFIDSERCVNRCGCVTVYNTEFRLLEYVKDLLKHLGIESTGPKSRKVRGRTFYDPRTKKI